MKNANNVISFPRQNTNVREPKKLEEIHHNLDMMKHYHIQETVLNLAPIIFNHLDIAGFGLSEEEDDDIKDGAFIIEALRSIMFKHYEMYHPFQDIAENIFSEEKDDEGVFKIVESINIEFKKEDDEEENE